MMNRQLLPQIGLYYFLQGVEYDPEVIRDAARKDSGKCFVPNRWPDCGNPPKDKPKARMSVQIAFIAVVIFKCFMSVYLMRVTSPA